MSPRSANAQQGAVGIAATGPSDEAGIEFFEKKVRPILVDSCFTCHSTPTNAAARKPGGNLSLDSRLAMLKGGTTGPAIVPGHPEQSRLIEAVSYTKSDMQMPPGKKLPDNQIADLTEWIRRGAPWPANKADSNGKASGPKRLDGQSALGSTQSEQEKERRKRQHWAFQPVRKTTPPSVKQVAWPRTPIDRFLLAKMEAKRVTPAPSADRRTLIRRAYFDLIGLPPKPEEIEAFIQDKSPNAWEQLIDKLLASPHYGERWGRFWLDVARYGEDQAHSFQPRLYPQGFRYRDWLAKALNDDMGYDRFVKEQIAADLLDEPDLREQLPALGFFALGPVYYGDEKMFDQYDDRIDTLARGFLGLTVACARCHDHKFDPVTQKDYYALAGIFSSTGYVEVPLPEGNGKFGKAEACINRHDRIGAQEQELDKFLNTRRDTLRQTLTSEIARYLLATHRYQISRNANPKTSLADVARTEGLQTVVLERWERFVTSGPGKNRPELTAWRTLLQKPEATSAEITSAATAFQSYVLALISRRDGGKPKPNGGEVAVALAAKEEKPKPLEKAEQELLNEIVGNEGVLTLPRDQVEKLLADTDKARLNTLSQELARLKAAPFVHSLMDGGKSVNCHVLLRGNPERPGEEAPRHFLTILAGENPPLFQKGSGRLELANAIADKNNPLTARVMVNRIWQHHFGVGIVRTTSNFGLLGEPPTHPELLDYLASQFMEQGWSLKRLHKEIMLSAAYKASGASNPHNEEIDPDNRLLWRMTPRRLEVEAWRDAMLSVTGKLDTAIGGPSLSLGDPNNRRRTYYASVSRHDLDAMLRLFDFPDPNVTADTRTNTTVPLQQLFVLNSEFIVRQAKNFAAFLTSNKSDTNKSDTNKSDTNKSDTNKSDANKSEADKFESDATRIRRAFLLAYGRPPSDAELRLGMAFVQETPKTPSAGNATEAGSHNLPTRSPAQSPNQSPAQKSRLTRWEEYAQVLLSANEFMYID